MPPQATAHTPRFSPAEQWLIHAVMLDRLGYGAPTRPTPPEPYVCELAVVDKLESDAPSFTDLELERIKQGCLDYADREATAASDRALAVDVIERVNAHLHSPHTAPR